MLQLAAYGRPDDNGIVSIDADFGGSSGGSELWYIYRCLHRADLSLRLDCNTRRLCDDRSRALRCRIRVSRIPHS